MSIQFRCPSCRSTFSTSDGKSVKRQLSSLSQ